MPVLVNFSDIFPDYRDELSINKGWLMKGTHIAIPRVLRKDMLVKLHESHIGVE